MSCLQNEIILEGLYEEILDDLSAKNIQWGVMLPMADLEEIASKEATRRFEDMLQ